MDTNRKHLAKGVALGVVATLLALFVIALAVAYSGSYNVAASAGHTAGMRWLLDTTRHASVRSRAPEPDRATLLAAADLAAGAGEYKAMCETCHGGPGVEPTHWSRGMLPQPPLLVEAASEWEVGEIYWMVRHGIKYTAMPSFGETHDDQTLWNIAAFAAELPGMTARQYEAFGAAHPHGASAPAQGHDHDRGHEDGHGEGRAEGHDHADGRGH